MLALLSACATTAPPQNQPLPPPDPQEPTEQLGKSDIVSGMSRAKDGVAACYYRYYVAGMASVVLKISHDGRPTDVRVDGPLATTPTGNCVANAVATYASFRPYTGAIQTITYPFILR
jgi:hypothetical protein